MRRAPCFPLHAKDEENVTEGLREILTNMDQDSTSEKVATTEDTSAHPTILEPAKPIDGPRIHLYTSLSSGSSSANTAQLRIETLFKANKIPYEIVDLATDEKAKKVWRWHGKGRKLPGVVRVTEDGETIIGGLEEVDEANEYGELKQLVLEGGN